MHSHAHEKHSSLSALRIALGVTLLILAIELVGGFLAQSLALLADAAHMLTDVAAAALALWAAGIAQRTPDSKRTFGYGRATILAASANAALLLLIVGAIVYEALMRFAHPPAVDSKTMLLVGAVSITLNMALGLYLSRSESTLNVRALIAHILGDALISAGVVVAAITIFFTGVNAIDPALSIVAAVLVVFSTWGVLKESVNVLLEGVPQGIDLAQMQRFLRSNVAIEDIHDLHVWCLSEGGVAASLHIRIAQSQLHAAPDIVRSVKETLHHEFDVAHATIEVECVDCEASC